MVAAPKLDDFTNDEIKECLEAVRHPFEIAVCNSENYFNCGSIIRTAHNFLARKVHMVGLEKYYKKATMGAKKYEVIEKHSIEEFVEMTFGRNVVALERRPPYLETKDLIHFEWPDDPIMVLGGEKYGIPDEIMKIACDVVSVPVYGVLNDFNVAVCAGIAMYDWCVKHYRK